MQGKMIPMFPPTTVRLQYGSALVAYFVSTPITSGMLKQCSSTLNDMDSTPLWLSGYSFGLICFSIAILILDNVLKAWDERSVLSKAEVC